MEGQSNVLLIILLFILRMGIPVLVTVAIAYGLRRLDARWQAEAEAEAKAQTKVVAPKAPQPQPARTGNGAGNGSGNGVGINAPLRQPLPVAMAAGQPCWSIKGCSESMRANCAAFHQPNVPCWSARMNAEGRLPAGCKDCKLYQPAAPIWTEQGLILH